jgi:hypothetical protein
MNKGSKFRKRPIVIDAIRIPAKGDDVSGLLSWLRERGGIAKNLGIPEHGSDGCVVIRTLEGTMIGNPGDWIICGVLGELYPCKDDIFRETYELLPKRAEL